MTSRSQIPTWTPGRLAALAGLLVVWFGAAGYIGTAELLRNEGGAPFPPIALTVVVPVALFALAYAALPAFRRFVLAQDLTILTMFQLWRVVGFAFLALYAYGVLPGLFAWPAGLGDVAVGIAAFFVTARLIRDPDYSTSNGLVAFHLFGLADFAGALGTAALAAGTFPALIPEGVTSAPMDVWPLSLFPSFIVPVFIILQLSALLKIRHLRRERQLPQFHGAATAA